MNSQRVQREIVFVVGVGVLLLLALCVPHIIEIGRDYYGAHTYIFE